MSDVPVLELGKYEAIVVLTGAGISVASGLPTYRGPGGLWEQASVQSYATAAAMEADPARVWEFFARRREAIVNAVPNAAHLALAQAERGLHSGQRFTLITQNVDGLHRAAGSKRVVELHGSLHRSRCTNCDYCRNENLATAPVTCPACPDCGACMRSDVVLFDEALPVDAVSETREVLRACGLFIAIGTSGMVTPASNFVRSAQYAGARTIYVNLEPMNPHNPAFEETYLGRAEEVVPRLFGTSAP